MTCERERRHPRRRGIIVPDRPLAPSAPPLDHYPTLPTLHKVPSTAALPLRLLSGPCAAQGTQQPGRAAEARCGKTALFQEVSGPITLNLHRDILHPVTGRVTGHLPEFR